jgi:RimJ/RimL family protein N-acetyltransferase
MLRHMGDLGELSWPPEPIATHRLLLRPTEARDRDPYINLLCSEDVNRYLGGPQPRQRVERNAPQVPGHRPGVFAVLANDVFVGTVTVDRRDPQRLGHLTSAGNEVEIGYLFLPEHWGQGYATEAVAAVLGWIDQALPEEPVVLCTQTANTASMRLAERLGFREIERFMEFDAEQWFGAREPGGRFPE